MRPLTDLVAFSRDHAGSKGEAIRLLGKARSELEFLRDDELLDDLTGRLAGSQKTVRDVGEAVALQYFHSVPWVA